MTREPETTERRRCHQCAEKHGPRQARLQEIGFAAAPFQHIVDSEGNPDTKQSRKGDDIGIIEREPGQSANFQCCGARHEERDEGYQNIPNSL